MVTHDAIFGTRIFFVGFIGQRMNFFVKRGKTSFIRAQSKFRCIFKTPPSNGFYRGGRLATSY